jgi:hypothetical protein
MALPIDTKSSLVESGREIPKIQDTDLPQLRETLNGLHELKQKFTHALQNSKLDDAKLKEARLVFNLALKLENEFAFLADPKVTSLDDNQQQLVNVKFLKTIFSVASESADLLSKKENESVKEFIPIFSNSSICDTLDESNRDNLDVLFHEIITAQHAFSKILTPPVYEKGDSIGILYRIQKAGTIRGYLFGTMHDLKTPEMLKTANLSEEIYKRLFQCAILGTELKFTQGTEGESVENSLIAFARQRGIFNLGLDSKERDVGTDLIQRANTRLGEILIDENMTIPENMDPDKKAELKKLIELKKKGKEALNQIARAYCEGNSSEIYRLFENERKENPVDEPRHIEQKRQAAMIQNIDACLHALERVKRDSSEEIPKGFFGVGLAHVICDQEYSPTIVEGLAQLDWNLLPC